MKVVFPRKGTFILQKDDLSRLTAYYNTTLLTSKIYDFFKKSDNVVQVKSFDYIPSGMSIVLHNTTFLSISEMRNIINSDVSKPQQPTETKKQISEPKKVEENKDNSDKKISDKDLLSNPFFQTLRPL